MLDIRIDAAARPFGRRPASRAVLTLALCALAFPPAALRGQEPGAATPAPAVAAPTDCQTEIAAIRKLYASIPVDFRGLSAEALEAAARNVTACRDRLDAFLTRCADTKACDAPFMLARLNTSLAMRVRTELFQGQNIPGDEVARRMQAYHLHDVARLQKALECVGDDPEQADLRCRAQDLLGDVYFHLSDWENSLASYRAAIDADCGAHFGAAELGNSIVGAGRSYLELRRTEEGLDFLRKAIRDRYRSPSLPFFYEVYWNLLVAHGDIDGMKAWCEDVRKSFPLRLLRTGLSKSDSDAFRRFLGYSGFRRGYARFAAGDTSGASSAFAQHIEDMNALEAELAKSNQTLPQELRIYRTRSVDNLDILERKVGKLPDFEIDTDDLWATSRHVSLATERDNARTVAILFRNQGDERSAGFFAGMDRHAGLHPDQRTFVVIHFLKGARDPQGQLAKVIDEMVELGIENAAVGMDPDAESKSMFRAADAMVGSATFLIFDRQGRLAWWQQDPRAVDVRLGAKIWDRLAAE